jgi:hypothetical protein
MNAVETRSLKLAGYLHPTSQKRDDDIDVLNRTTVMLARVNGKSGSAGLMIEHGG